MIDFGGERMVITGAGGGVGQALVDVFSNLGAAVVACDVEGSDLLRPSAEIRMCAAARANISNPRSRQNCSPSHAQRFVASQSRSS